LTKRGKTRSVNGGAKPIPRRKIKACYVAKMGIAIKVKGVKGDTPQGVGWIERARRKWKLAVPPLRGK